MRTTYSYCCNFNKKLLIHCCIPQYESRPRARANPETGPASSPTNSAPKVPGLAAPLSSKTRKPAEPGLHHLPRVSHLVLPMHFLAVFFLTEI